MSEIDEIEQQIASSGLHEKYIQAIIDILDLGVVLFHSALEGYSWGGGVAVAIFEIMHASDEVKKQAAIMAQRE